MQDSIYRFSLDIHSTQSQVSIPVPQFNTARSIQATLTEGGKPYQLSHECRAVFTATKADGTTLNNNCIILNGSVIRYDFTEQTTTAAGVVYCSIKVYGANQKLLTSPRFTLVVYDDPTGEVTPSANEMNVIDKIMSNDVTQDAAIAEINEELKTMRNQTANGNGDTGDNGDKVVGYLVSTGDTTDRLAEIQALLDNNGYAKLGKGEFYLSGQLRIRNGATLDGCGMATVIKQTPDSTQSSMIWLQSMGTIRNVCLQGEWTSSPTADTTYNAYRIGIVISGGTNNAIIDGCWIWGWTAHGVFASGNSTATRSFLMSNCDVCYCGTGLYLEKTEYACVTNCAFRNNKYGVENKGGNNKFSACGFDMNIEGFRLMDGYNDGHGSVIGSTFNHNSVRAVRVSGVEIGFVFSGCQFHDGCINNNSGKGLVFSGCQFGNYMKYYNYTTSPTLFIGCTFSQTPQTESEEYLDAYNGLRFVNCINYLKDETIDNTPVSATETWSFTLEDGSTITKDVMLDV